MVKSIVCVYMALIWFKASNRVFLEQEHYYYIIYRISPVWSVIKLNYNMLRIHIVYFNLQNHHGISVITIRFLH